MSNGRIGRISLAPVKGLGLVHPSRVELDLQGARGDRRFHLVDTDGRMLNGKRRGELVRVSPEHDAEADVLRLHLPDGRVVAGPVELGEPIETSFFGRPVTGRVVEGPFAAALSDLAGLPLRLIRPDAPGAAADRGHTVSLISRGSLESLSADAGLEEPLDGRRFRMSLELEGLPAYAEDAWVGRRIRIGTATAVVRGNVGRCLVTSHDPDRGVADVDTLGALATFRGELETTEPLPLGVWGAIVDPGAAALGDEVAIAD